MTTATKSKLIPIERVQEAQQKLNPAPPDPIQARVMMALPVIFVFLFATFPAGLVIYWTWNNVLSIAQQWVIMRRMGVPA